MPLEQRLKEQLKAQLEQHAPHARKLLLAVSGGSDSVALLRLLLAIRVEKQLELEVAHFHHHIRPVECQRDADFTLALCNKLELPCHCDGADIPRIAEAKGMNQEACSRQLRYAFLHRVAKKCNADAIVTAHTQDDQAETVLMQLMRGTAFLRGIAGRQKFLLRPLLAISRQELQDYLALVGQDFMIDSTNFDTNFTRAWLRHSLLPLWSQRQPDIKQKLAALAGKQQQQAAHFAAISQSWLTNTDAGLSLRELQKADEAVRQHIVAQLLKKLELAVNDAHIQQLSHAIRVHQPAQVQRLSLKHHHYARLGYDELRIIAPTAAPVTIAPLDWQALPPEIDTEKLRRFAQRQGLTRGLVRLERRTRRSGDRIQLASGSKKINALLIDRKIPHEERDSLPLIALGSQVLWLDKVAVDIRVRNEAFRSHAYWMGLALEAAQQAFAQGEIPVGAVVVQGNRLLAQAHNLTEGQHDPSAHAEVLALRQAAQALQDWRLSGCRLYVSLEPCLMCLGAMLQAHLPQLIYAADNPREGALGGVANIQRHDWKRKIDVMRGIRRHEAEALLKAFFQQKRA